MTRSRSLVALLLVSLAAASLSGCLVSRARATGPSAVDDDVDQQGWASTRTEGTGDDSPGFYGAHASPSPQVRAPATARPGHTPYAPGSR
ncbi:MAG: hypothetical protein OZ921_07140 [Sorangiineae bacterium]|nr:hypothetical protein [Polyangiaceae bacterium]MEB2322270.1 hypothetical protein [Sorangiineae bacterium]